MINAKTFKAAIKIFKAMECDNVSLSIDNNPIDINSKLISFGEEKDTNSFIEFDIDKEKNSIYIWIWSNKHPQYQWIKDNTSNEYTQGIFRIVNNGMMFMGSIDDVA